MPKRRGHYKSASEKNKTITIKECRTAEQISYSIVILKTLPVAISPYLLKSRVFKLGASHELVEVVNIGLVVLAYITRE